MSRKFLVSALALPTLAILATVLRVAGFEWGLPYAFHPDEMRILDGVWQEYWGFTSLDSDYGMLPMTLYALAWKAIGVFSPAFARAPMASSNFALSMSSLRLLAALAGISSVLYLYCRLVPMVGKAAAWTSAFILAVSPLHVQLSHFITVDVYLLLFMMIAAFSLCDLASSRGSRNLALIGLSVGCALSTKLSSLPLFLLACALIALVRLRSHSFSLKNAGLAIFDILTVVVISAAVFMALHPKAWHPEAYFLSDKSDPWWWHFSVSVKKFDWNLLMVCGDVAPLWALGSQLSLPARALNLLWAFGLPAFGGLLFLRRGILKSHATVLAVLAASGAAMALPSFISPVFFCRYALPLLPALCVLSGLGLSSLLRSRRVATGLYTAILGSGLLLALATSSIYLREDSRMVVGKTLEQHAPANSTVCVEDEPASNPLIDLSRYSTVTMPIYLWDMHMRDQVSPGLRALESSHPGSLALPKRWTASESERNIDEVISQCSFIVISDRHWDQLAGASPSHPLAGLYRRMAASEAPFTVVSSVHSRPRLFGIDIDDSWAEHTLRIFDHPSFMIVRNNSAAAR